MSVVSTRAGIGGPRPEANANAETNINANEKETKKAWQGWGRTYSGDRDTKVRAATAIAITTIVK